MRTLGKESEILDRYRSIPIKSIRYIGNIFSCLRIMMLTHSHLFKRSWIDSSSKDAPPPDYYNDKYHIMMEMMRVDDCVGNLNGKRVSNAFEKENVFLKKHLGNNYKLVRDDISVFFIPNTDDPTKYTYKGYLDSFRSVVMKHSNKTDNYKKNHPNCKATIFLISDESNEFCEVLNPADKKKVEDGYSGVNAKWHIPYRDNKFIDIIKKTKCDYIVWVYNYKTERRGNQLLVPQAVIIDVKRLKRNGIDYNELLMAKVKEVHHYDTV